MIQRFTIATCLLAFLMANAIAQSPDRETFFRLMGGLDRLLVEVEDVREELGVNELQAELLDALQQDLAEQRRAIHEEDFGPRSADENIQRFRLGHLIEKLKAFDRRSETLVKVILEPKQAARLTELYLQREGIRALDRPEVASKLQLDDDQKQQIQELRETLAAKRPQAGSPAQRRELFEKERQGIRKLFNDEQQTLWKQLLGEPFEFPKAAHHDLRLR
jgi:hypothetical protein